MMITGEVVRKDIPFQEAIDSFRSKTRISTRHYTDVLQEMHARAFMVAGAQQDDLLAGFQQAIDKGLARGTTLAEFRDDFDRLVAAHGWSYHGTPGRRSKIIYETNMRTSYMSGKWEQAQQDKKAHPYARYVAVQDRRTRKEHQDWHGWIVSLDDPWWDTHWPPNGWGCRCTAEPVSDFDLRKGGETVTTPPPDQFFEVNLKGPDGPVPVKTVPGIDPGWAYNPGKAGFGKQVSGADKQAMGKEAWGEREPLILNDWQSAKRPADVPADAPKARLAPVVSDAQAFERILHNVLDGPEKFFFDPSGGTVLLSAAGLASHVATDRSPFLPLLPEIIADPYEIWLSLERRKATGRVELRKRYIKRFELPGKGRATYLVAQVEKGQFVGWTFVPASKLSELNKQRLGKLLWGRA
jgi:SPP1 gp7 family putative phage head morphogenesis protein